MSRRIYEIRKPIPSKKLRINMVKYYRLTNISWMVRFPRITNKDEQEAM